jgi:CO dehydrogenase maturation factor
MRVAVAGKGGAGKTTISATLARTAARRGETVLAVDADSNPNLAIALGCEPEVRPPTLPLDLVARRLSGPELSIPVADFLAQHTVAAPDGVHLVAMGAPGHVDEGCLCSAHAGVSAVLAAAGALDLTMVDLEASPEHLSRGTARHVEVLLLVAEPYYRSIETVRRMAELAAELPIPTVGVVANKVRDAGDRDAIEEFCRRWELPLLGEVPYSDGVITGDRDRVPLADKAGEPAGEAIALLLDRLRGQPVGA